jgi:hypothetical protein
MSELSEVVAKALFAWSGDPDDADASESILAAVREAVAARPELLKELADTHSLSVAAER